MPGQGTAGGVHDGKMILNIVVVVNFGLEVHNESSSKNDTAQPLAGSIKPIFSHGI